MADAVLHVVVLQIRAQLAAQIVGGDGLADGSMRAPRHSGTTFRPAVVRPIV